MASTVGFESLPVPTHCGKYNFGRRTSDLYSLHSIGRTLFGAGDNTVNCSKILSVTLFMSVGVQAHHSPNLHFDRENIVEISGQLTQADWQNPHTQLSVTTSAEDGSETVWLIEGRSAHQFTRAGVTRDFFKIGSDIRVAGFRGRRNPTAMFATNILLADGRELVTDSFVAPRWSGGTAIMLTASNHATAAEDVPASANGIFRVWGPDRSDHGIDGTGRTLWLDSYPLTESARSTQACTPSALVGQFKVIV